MNRRERDGKETGKRRERGGYLNKPERGGSLPPLDKLYYIHIVYHIMPHDDSLTPAQKRLLKGVKKIFFRYFVDKTPATQAFLRSPTHTTYPAEYAEIRNILGNSTLKPAQHF